MFLDLCSRNCCRGGRATYQGSAESSVSSSNEASTHWASIALYSIAWLSIAVWCSIALPWGSIGSSWGSIALHWGSIGSSWGSISLTWCIIGLDRLRNLLDLLNNGLLD